MPCEALSQHFLSVAIEARLAHVRVTSPHFLALHAFYKDVYESCEKWFDALAERARAEREDVESFTFEDDVQTGDHMASIKECLQSLVESCTESREKEEPTTQAIIDEALADVEKFLWQLKAMK
jgi:DNA-binding ferritin-like protein